MCNPTKYTHLLNEQIFYTDLSPVPYIEINIKSHRLIGNPFVLLLGVTLQISTYMEESYSVILTNLFNVILDVFSSDVGAALVLEAAANVAVHLPSLSVVCI